MDFINGLPPSYGRTTIFVVVDRLSKYGHFTPLKHPYTAAQLAQTFFEVIFKLHGIPSSIVCDRDPSLLEFFGGSSSASTGLSSTSAPPIIPKQTAKRKW
jgi:hypothetical protein